MKKITIALSLFIAFLVVTNSCSTKKNTASRRFFHNLTAYFNIYFNGNESLKMGLKKIDEMPDNYTILLPIYKAEKEEVESLVSSDMDLAIKKAVKMIKMHSITVKPKRKKNKRGGKIPLTKKEREFYKKTEYNDFVDDAYLLIGKAHYYKQDYYTGMKSLQLILNKFRKEEIRYDAMYWIARSYLSLNDFKSAESYLNMILSDEKHPEKLNYDIDLAFIDLNIKQKKYNEAIDRLKLIVDKTKKRKKRARLKFILAQLYQKVENDREAMKTYAEVIKMNPPYDMAFSAKISMAKSFSSGGKDAERLRKSLKKMLRDDKNIDYQDQIYFALAELSAKENNEKDAVYYYKYSIEKSKSNQNQKALSYLALADIYFLRPDYMNSGAYYDSAMTVLDKKHPDYTEISQKANNLSELITNLKIVAFEDSVQRIAKMDSVARLAFVENIIAQLKQREQAERRGIVNNDPNRNNFNPNQQGRGGFYFYNPQALSIGQTTFKNTWGNRKLEDHWRRKNKQVIAIDVDEDDENAGKDSTGRVTDNKKPEYYLQDLPLNDSLIAISNNKIAKALYDAGVVYERKMNDYPEATKSYNELKRRFPKHDLIVESYFNMYLINYKKLKNKAEAEKYRQKILKEYPYSKYAKILSDPNYLKNLEKTKNQINKLYAEVYDSYKNSKFQDVIKKADEAEKVSKGNELTPKFWYFKALSQGSLGNQEKMVLLLEDVIKKYPKNEITPQAKAVLAVIKSGKYDANYYSLDGNAECFYEIVLDKDKDLINKVRFALDTYNTKNFPEKKLEIKQADFGKNKAQLTVRNFADKQEGLSYIQGLKAKNALSKAKLKNYNEFIISKENHEKLDKLPIVEKYLKFYSQNY